jgi:hypothetical protein
MMHDQVFELFQLVQVPFDLGVAPAGKLANVTAAKVSIAAKNWAILAGKTGPACGLRSGLQRG